MNAISAFFVRNIVAVYFFYGLAFFTMGIALLLASRRSSQFRFAAAILPLALFGFVHATNEWYEMFQKINFQTTAHMPSLGEELLRLVLLVASFLLLLLFGLVLLNPTPQRRARTWGPLLWVLLLWATGVGIVIWRWRPAPLESIAIADNLARYGLAIPAAVIGAWALMAQQRIFREQNMSRFGRDLVWAAAALVLYGAIGQIFVTKTLLIPSQFLNTANFLAWFGIPVQLFRAVMATALTIFIIRALQAFDLESRRRLDAANEARLQAQAQTLAAERRTSQQMERLNEELRLSAHKLSLLLDLSNLLATPLPLAAQLHAALQRIVESLTFSEAGLIALSVQDSDHIRVMAATGFMAIDAVQESISDDDQLPYADYLQASALGSQCIARGVPLCLHLDGGIIEFVADTPPERNLCQQYQSPTRMLGYPLGARQHIIGSLVLARRSVIETTLAPAELALMAGIAQQLGLSVENALLRQEVETREHMLGDLLRQVVTAQEDERQRIARELHDATGQSLTAIGLGLRGIENVLARQPECAPPEIGEQMRELRTFSQNALGELRHIITDLRPPQLDELGLIAALRWYVTEYARRRAIETRLFATGEDSLLPAEYKTVLFRIAQESLTNIAKHAEATSADIVLNIQPEQVVLDIRDNGRGFDLQQVSERQLAHPGGWGLVGIRERALSLGGRYEIETDPGSGVHLHVSVPLNNSSDLSDH